MRSIFGYHARLWIGSLLVGLVLLICLGLGGWQLQRLRWKQALNAQRITQFSAPPLHWDQALVDPSAAAFRSIRLVGSFDHDKEMQIGARRVAARSGVDIMTPFRLSEGDSAGQIVLVLRGWVPLERRAPEMRPQSQPIGEIVLLGWLREPPRISKLASWLVPENRPEQGYWVHINLLSMALYAGLAVPPPLYIQAAPVSVGQESIGQKLTLPIPRAHPNAALPNPHLFYALTWFGLALILIVISLMIWKNKKWME